MADVANMVPPSLSQSQKATEPPEPAWMGKDEKVEDLKVYQPSGPAGRGNKKLLGLLGIVLAVVSFTGLTFLGLRFFNLNKKETDELKQASQQTLSEGLIPPAERDLQLGPGEKKEVTDWRELTSPLEIENREIASQVLDWLDEQRDSRGIYILGYRCISGEGCAQQDADNRAGLAAIWGRFKYYQQLADPNDLAIIEKDLSLYTDAKTVSVIQNNFWNCKLMYEMWRSGLFSSEQKDKIKKICDQGSYYPPDLEEIDEKIKSGQGEIVDFNQLLQNKAEASLTPFKRSSQGIKLIEYAAYASDFAAKYLWQKNEADLLRAQIYFDKGVNLLVQEPVDSYLEGKCVLGIAALDIYQAANNSAYLVFAKLLLEKEKVQDFCLASSEEAGYCSESLFEQSTCGLFTAQLADLSGETQYRELKDSFINQSKSNLFNLPEYSDGGEGKGAFFSKIKLSDKQTLFYKAIRENGLFVGLLMM